MGPCPRLPLGRLAGLAAAALALGASAPASALVVAERAAPSVDAASARLAAARTQMESAPEGPARVRARAAVRAAARHKAAADLKDRRAEARRRSAARRAQARAVRRARLQAEAVPPRALDAPPLVAAPPPPAAFAWTPTGATPVGPSGAPTFLAGAPAAAYATTGLSYPLALRGPVIGTPYGGTHTLGNWQSDRAVDIEIPVGTPVVAIEDGVIGPRIGALGNAGSRFAGLRLTLQGRTDSYYYAHLSALAVGAGQPVVRGQVIGWSGEANGVPHLHLGLERGDPVALVGG